jgi:hypothetical protein
MANPTAGNHYAGIFLLAISAVVMIFDIYMFARHGEENTISYVILHASMSNPIIPFTVGILMGHLFWRQ